MASSMTPAHQFRPHRRRPDKRRPRLFSRDKRLPKNPRFHSALNRLPDRHARALPFLLGHLRIASSLTPAFKYCPHRLTGQTCVGPAFSLGTSSRSQRHEGKGGASGRPAYLQRPTSARTRSPRTPRDRPQACRSRAVPDRAGALRTARPSRLRQPAERRTAWRTPGAER